MESAKHQCAYFGTPRGRGFATATTSAAFFPHCEHRSRGASADSVVEQPRNCPKQSSSFLM